MPDMAKAQHMITCIADDERGIDCDPRCPVGRPQIEKARENAQRTYDRRRARNAAETLAGIPPNRWDAATKAIIATLATIASPSRINDMLEAFDGQPADALIEVHGGQFVTTTTPTLRDRMGSYPRVVEGVPGALCGSSHHHGTLEQAKACDDLPRHCTGTALCPVHPDQRAAHRVHDNGGCRMCPGLPECAPGCVHDNEDCPPWCGVGGPKCASPVHDNGDYRA